MRHHLWVQEAIQKIVADGTRSADTHLLKVEWPAAPDIQWYLKDESTHITGSLKHRLSRALFLYGLCNGWIITIHSSSRRPRVVQRCPRLTSLDF